METNKQKVNGAPSHVATRVRSLDGFVVSSSGRTSQLSAKSVTTAAPKRVLKSPNQVSSAQSTSFAKPAPRLTKKAALTVTAKTAKPMAGKYKVATCKRALPYYKAPKHPRRIVRKRHSWQFWTLRIASVTLAVFLATGGFLVWRGYDKLHKVFRGTSTVAALSSRPVDPNLLKGEGDGRVNILLAGIGGAGHDGPDLTDTLLILSVDPVNNTAALLSVPRDLWVKQPVNYFGANQKINAVYESGKYKYLGKLDASGANTKAVEAGFAAEDQIMSQVLGITINYHVLIDFQAFRQAIDTVGGVTVDVPEALYDPTMAWENGNNPTLAVKGLQVMNGTKALMYARSRETTSDFARTQRQRQVLLALKDKVLSAGTLSNPAKIDGLINSFGDNVYSDLSTGGAQRLFTILRNIDDSKIASLGFAQPPVNLVTTDHVGNISVVRPLAGFDNYSAIQTYVHAQLPDGYLLKEKAPVSIIGSTQAIALNEATKLTGYGYTLAGTTVATATLNTSPVLIDLSGGKDPYTLHYLESRFGVKAVTSLPSGVTKPTPATKFVILVSK